MTVNYFSPADADLPVDPVDHLYDHRSLDSWNHVDDRLAVGGDDHCYEPTRLLELLDAGFTHTLDCRSSGEIGGSGDLIGPDGRRLAVRHNPTADDGWPKPLGYWQNALRLADRVLSQPGTRLYVHCAMGVNRGPSNLYAILRGPHYELGTVEALTAIRTARPGAAVAYWRDVDDAVRTLHGR